MKPSRYNKFLVAMSAALAVAVSVTADGELSANDILAIVSSAIGAVSVYAVRNAQPEA